jgi:hypothetical protein
MRLMLVSLAVLVLSSAAAAQVVVNPRITINDSIDCSSAAEVVKQIITDKMTDEQKAIACWQFMLNHFYHWFPPIEDTSTEPVRDFAKAINSYGFSPCFGNAPVLTDLWEAAGFKTRSWTISGHSIPEVFYGNAWHMIDADARAFHRKADGQIASVDELGHDAKLLTNPAGGKSDPFYPFGAPDQDVSPLIPWGPPSKMMDLYLSTNDNYPYNKRAVSGHAMYLALRQGEELTLSPDNVGKWFEFIAPTTVWKRTPTPGAATIETKLDKGPASIDGKLTYGNGTLNWKPDFAKIKPEDLLWAGSANVQLKDGTLIAADASKPAVAVLRVYCPWVLVAADLSIDAATSEAMAIEVSTDGGKSWFVASPLAGGGNAWNLLSPLPAADPAAAAAGVAPAPAAKPKTAAGCYEYLLRVTLKNGAINNLKVNNTFQVAQLSLPTLKVGKNAVKVFRGPDEGVVALVLPEEKAAKERYIFETKGLTLATGKNPLTAAKREEPGYVVYKLTAPDALKAISVGACAVLDKGDRPSVTAEYSLDGGKTWKQAWKLAKNTNGQNAMFEEDAKIDLPDNASKEALIKYTITGDSSFDRGMQFGGVRSIRCYGYYKLAQTPGAKMMVDLNWVEESGNARADKGLHQLVDKFPTEFNVDCAGEKVMLKSIVFKLAE